MGKLSGDDLEAYLSKELGHRRQNHYFRRLRRNSRAFRMRFEMVDDLEFKEKATTALGPFPLIIGEEAGEIVKKAAVFSDNTKDQLNAALKKNRFTYRVQ